MWGCYNPKNINFSTKHVFRAHEGIYREIEREKEKKEKECNEMGDRKERERNERKRGKYNEKEREMKIV